MAVRFSHILLIAGLCYVIGSMYLYFGSTPPSYECPTVKIPECQRPPPSPDSSIQSPGKDWQFIEYKSSSWEQMWIDNSRAWGRSPCQRYWVDSNNENSHYWVDYSAKHQNVAPTSPPRTDIFSTFKFKNGKGEIVETYIEPLALVTRNPYFCEYGGSHVADKSYLFVDWTLKDQVRDSGGKVYFFDLGASTWNTGSYGASQSWFAEQLKVRGLKLSGIWAWEAELINATKVYEELPGEYWDSYHWYNIPASAIPGEASNPHTILKRVAKPEDLVVLKIDIDTPEIESVLVQQVLDDPELSKLIDVMFYEMHINLAEMSAWWGRFNYKDTLTDLHNVFVKARKLGIRLHSWV